jgi:hypothetical protein
VRSRALPIQFVPETSAEQMANKFITSLKATGGTGRRIGRGERQAARREAMAIGEEDVRRLVQLYEMRDEVEQAIVGSRSRLAEIQREISDAENHFRGFVRPTQTLRLFHWQHHDIVVRWTLAGATIELRESMPLE